MCSDSLGSYYAMHPLYMPCLICRCHGVVPVYKVTQICTKNVKSPSITAGQHKVAVQGMWPSLDELLDCFTVDSSKLIWYSDFLNYHLQCLQFQFFKYWFGQWSSSWNFMVTTLFSQLLCSLSLHHWGACSYCSTMVATCNSNNVHANYLYHRFSHCATRRTILRSRGWNSNPLTTSIKYPKAQSASTNGRLSSLFVRKHLMEKPPPQFANRGLLGGIGCLWAPLSFCSFHSMLSFKSSRDSF